MRRSNASKARVCQVYRSTRLESFLDTVPPTTVSRGRATWLAFLKVMVGRGTKSPASGKTRVNTRKRHARSVLHINVRSIVSLHHPPGKAARDLTTPVGDFRRDHSWGRGASSVDEFVLGFPTEACSKRCMLHLTEGQGARDEGDKLDSDRASRLLFALPKLVDRKQTYCVAAELLAGASCQAVSLFIDWSSLLGVPRAATLDK
jgi:hypothetical protein